jgi:homocysteine S-methyltransferase
MDTNDVSHNIEALISTNKLVQALKERVLFLDGGLATQLEEKGIVLHRLLWSAYCIITHPELITSVHLDYLRHGADIITTSSYQASYEGFSKIGVGEKQVDELMKKSVELARTAVKQYQDELKEKAEVKHISKCIIAGSLGPYGAILANGAEFRGDYVGHMTAEQLKEFHRPRVRALLQGGVDVIAAETCPALKEAQALAEMFEEPEWQQYNFVAWISFTIRFENESLESEPVTSKGESLEQVFEALQPFKRVVAVGVNCSTPLLISEAVKTAKKYCQNKAVIVYPNRGEDWEPVSQSWVPSPYMANKTLGQFASEWVQNGASILGGCCRTTPNDILSMREQILK